MYLFEIELFICAKINLALNNLQRLICHKTQTTNQTESQFKTDKKCINPISPQFAEVDNSHFAVHTRKLLTSGHRLSSDWFLTAYQPAKGYFLQRG